MQKYRRITYFLKKLCDGIFVVSYVLQFNAVTSHISAVGVEAS